ncbi:hypothetical protein [Acerihabitans sp.]|uniref:hypothetical protein n=1 Tax=Acerihabitans sp. TaxID=2811394 RepID=UPI002ED93477
MSNLKFNNSRKNQTHRLPFVGKKQGKIGLSLWNVPPTGGYDGGCETGKALALIFIKHLREHSRSPGGILQHIALDMFGVETLGIDDTRTGQAVGFFSEIEKCLAEMAPYMTGLDAIDPQVLLKHANRGLKQNDIGVEVNHA